MSERSECYLVLRNAGGCELYRDRISTTDNENFSKAVAKFAQLSALYPGDTIRLEPVE